jgi:erythromycin esterase-like protein
MVNPEAARRAAERYACFDHYGDDTQVYGIMTGLRLAKSCEEQAIRQLVELQRRVAEHGRQEGGAVADELFNAEQNARVVKDAEEYYRTMLLKEVSSWNLRDRHMAEMVETLTVHLGRHGERAKVAIWAHNSHLGDARATQASQRGELNLGQFRSRRPPDGRSASRPRRSLSESDQGDAESAPVSEKAGEARMVRVEAGPVTLEGDLNLPERVLAVVLFAHGSGSSRHSSRNR